MASILSVCTFLRDMHQRRTRSGFLLSELLAALLIISMLMPASIAIIRLAQNGLDFDENVQDEIATAQLRRILAASYDISTDGNTVYLSYLGRDMRLVYGNRHVYLTPGTQIFYSDIDDAWFKEEQEVIYICVQRNASTSEIALARTT